MEFSEHTRVKCVTTCDDYDTVSNTNNQLEYKCDPSFFFTCSHAVNE